MTILETRVRRFTSTHPIFHWLQKDPIGFRGGINLYGYVGNDPAYLTDPKGLDYGDGGCNCGEKRLYQLPPYNGSFWKCIQGIIGSGVQGTVGAAGAGALGARAGAAAGWGAGSAFAAAAAALQCYECQKGSGG